MGKSRCGRGPKGVMSQARWGGTHFSVREVSICSTWQAVSESDEVLRYARRFGGRILHIPHGCWGGGHLVIASSRRRTRRRNPSSAHHGYVIGQRA